MRTNYSVVQRQNAVSAYFTTKHILPFGFVEQYCAMLNINQSDCMDKLKVTLNNYNRMFCLTFDEWSIQNNTTCKSLGGNVNSSAQKKINLQKKLCSEIPTIWSSRAIQATPTRKYIRNYISEYICCVDWKKCPATCCLWLTPWYMQRVQRYLHCYGKPP